MAKTFKVITRIGNAEIRQYRGSSGYQVWRGAEFVCFMPTLLTASGMARLYAQATK